MDQMLLGMKKIMTPGHRKEREEKAIRMALEKLSIHELQEKLVKHELQVVALVENQEQPENSYLKKGTSVQQDELLEVNLGTMAEPRKTFVSTGLPEQEKDKMIELFKKYKDCFAWDYHENIK